MKTMRRLMMIEPLPIQRLWNLRLMVTRRDGVLSMIDMLVIDEYTLMYDRSSANNLTRIGNSMVAEIHHGESEAADVR